MAAIVWGFLISGVIMFLWNVVIPYFGGKEITYWVTYAGFWLIGCIGSVLKLAVVAKK